MNLKYAVFFFRFRQGYGSTLMDHGVLVCDVQNIAAYLDSTNPANIPFYERVGFKVVGEIHVGASPVLTRMLRTAK
jgi:ribosomal protein S18 acetylase RimI-like enzyme